MEKKEEKKVCCICGKEYEGYGYNPFPVKEEGCCCQSCNYSVGGSGTVGTTQGFSTW